MKPDILLLHGALGSKRQFDPIMDLLSDSFKVHNLNFEGHGGFESDNSFSIDLFTQNVVDYLQKHEITVIRVFGYSMGGYVALNTALRYPNLIHSIVTLGTKFDWTPESSQKEIKMLNPEVIQEKVPLFAKSLHKAHYPLDWKENMTKTAQMMLKLGEGARLSETDLRSIQHKVTIGIGNLDRMVSIEESEQASEFIPHSKLQILVDVKHPINSIDPTVIVEFILENS